MNFRSLAALLASLLAANLGAAPVGTAFTYQGTLEEGGTTANGSFDFEVGLFMVASGGTQLDVESSANRPVANGVFTLDIDFTDVPYRNRDALFLELRVRPGASTGAFTVLTPRQPINAVPYALNALSTAAGGGPAGRPFHTERIVPLGAGRVAGDSSIVTGSDGLPFIAVHDIANGDLVTVHCEDITCATRTITPLDTANQVGGNPSVLVASTGLPVIGYYDATNGDLRVAHCSNVACTSATFFVADAPGDVGRDAFAIYTRSGLPSFVYHDTTNGNLKAVDCGAATGSACNPAVTIDASANDVGRGVSAAYSGFRLFLAYHNQTTGQLLMKVCGNSASSCGTTAPLTVDATADSGDSSAVVVPPDGLPLILYTRSGGIRAARCATLACSGVVLTPNGVGPGIRLTALIGADYTPYVFGINAAMTGITQDRCGNSDCSSVIDVINAGFSVSSDGRPSMTMGGHGFPHISHRRGNDLQIFTCGANDCDSSTRR